MKITLLQTDIAWENHTANRNHAAKLIANSDKSDIFLFPEMFTTGFCTSPKGVAEVAETDTLQWMKDQAAKHDAAIAGSVAVVENGKYFNRFYFVKPDGTYSIYNKRHLFTFGGEHKEYTGGDERVVVEFRGFRILLLVCYDLRFPVFSRNMGDYDMIFYVANWPTPRVEAWSALLRARAIENVCYVAGVNRFGEDPTCQYCGGTAMIDFIGKTIAACEDNKEDTVTVELDMEALITFRKKFPALLDADKFLITT